MVRPVHLRISHLLQSSDWTMLTTNHFCLIFLIGHSQILRVVRTAKSIKKCHCTPYVLQYYCSFPSYRQCSHQSINPNLSPYLPSYPHYKHQTNYVPVYSYSPISSLTNSHGPSYSNSLNQSKKVFGPFASKPISQNFKSCFKNLIVIIITAPTNWSISLPLHKPPHNPQSCPRCWQICSLAGSLWKKKLKRKGLKKRKCPKHT